MVYRSHTKGSEKLELLTDSFISCCDSRKMIAELPDNFVDLAIIDPPYSELGNDLEPVLNEICRVEKAINAYIFCGQKQLVFLLNYFVTKRGCDFTLLCWHKTNPPDICSNKYLPDTDYILFVREKTVPLYGCYSSKFTYFVTQLNQAEKRKYCHPSVKPLDIITNLIHNSTNPNDIVFDPFLGTGTTAVAAEYLGRRYIGFEINEKYYETAFSRLRKDDDGS